MLFHIKKQLCCVIKDTLHCRTAEANAQALEAVYQNQQKSEQISRLRLWVNILGGVLAVLVKPIKNNRMQ